MFLSFSLGIFRCLGRGNEVRKCRKTGERARERETKRKNPKAYGTGGYASFFVLKLDLVPRSAAHRVTKKGGL